MKIKELTTKYPELTKLSERIGDFELYPPQAEALKSGFLDGKNLLLASPTSSGKTLVAEIAMAVNKKRGGKSIYLVPLRSLAKEKYDDFKELFNGELSVGMSIGDLTTKDDRIGKSDLIVCSYEKFDSLIRHGASWIKDVSLVIVDEVHLIDDTSRGPVIEVLLTRLKLLNKWIVALSATIGNPTVLGQWLKAIVIQSSYRPVKLLEGVFNSEQVIFKNDERVISAPDYPDLINNTLLNGKQSLIFVSNRRSAESVAEKMGELVKKSLSNTDLTALNELSRRVLKAISSPTTQCKRLASCIKNGTAFNHAGLINEQKALIESAYRAGLIKIISCTTVLAYGVSLPAYMVVIRDFKRFSDDGMNYFPVSEYLQIAGRAGRSGYDVEGLSVLVTNGDSERELAYNEYLCAKPSVIVSKLGVEPVMRFHALSLICDGTSSSITTLINFFKESFFGFDYGGEEFIESRVRIVTNDLVNWGFINELNNHLVPTKLGMRVNELYLDPLSAYKIIKGLEEPVINPIGFIHLASSCGEIQSIRVQKNDYPFILEELAVHEDELIVQKPSPFSYEYEGFMRAFKTSLMINEWISERGEDLLLEEYGIPPGSLHQLLANLEWILYSIGEIADVKQVKGVKEFTNGLILRVKYGVKSDLLTLVSLRGIGRVRARKLYINGFKTVSELRSAGIEKISKIIGPNTARKLIDSLDP